VRGDLCGISEPDVKINAGGDEAMIYVWRDYKTTISGTVVRRVTCEKCACAYAYELVRAASGAGTSMYLLDNSGAEYRARTRANKKLRRALERGVEPVQCPDCGWFQADMVREAQRRKARGLMPAAAICLTLAGAIALLMGALWLSPPPGGGPTNWSPVGVFGGAGAICLAIRWFMMRQGDLNRRCPERPAPYPGAPTAHKVQAMTPVAAGQPARVASGVGAFPTLPPRGLKASSKPRA
jgi:hypothetical protein